MVIFYSYVSLPEGTTWYSHLFQHAEKARKHDNHWPQATAVLEHSVHPQVYPKDRLERNSSESNIIKSSLYH